MRALITEKMQVATAYVDRLIVYEHVLNRIEARCTMNADELKRCADDINKEAFIRDIVNFIFEDKRQCCYKRQASYSAWTASGQDGKVKVSRAYKE